MIQENEGSYEALYTYYIQTIIHRIQGREHFDSQITKRMASEQCVQILVHLPREELEAQNSVIVLDE